MTSRKAHPASRSEARRKARCDAIVKVASQSFIEQGYAGTTMSDIAATLGGSKGTLWNHFPSKEVLFIAVVEHLTAAFRAELTNILTPGHDVETTLRKFCAEYLDKVTSSDGIALYRLVIRENDRFPEIGRIFYERGPQLTQAQLAGFFTDAMDRGVMRRDDPVHLAQHLTAICLSGVHQKLLMGLADHARRDQLSQDAERSVAVFMRAYSLGTPNAE